MVEFLEESFVVSTRVAPEPVNIEKLAIYNVMEAISVKHIHLFDSGNSMPLEPREKFQSLQETSCCESNQLVFDCSASTELRRDYYSMCETSVD